MILKAVLLLGCALGISTFPMEEPEDGGKHWVVIVAGSSGWYNYRHQADVCHAYQIVHRNGIPDEQIIVMMYDDIADNEENPTKGIVINRPNGSDVYAGVPKDYTKEDVTPKNFLAVLRGDEEAVKGVGSGKVLKSGPKDHVFVYFTDHGAPGLLAFPDDDLHVKDLNKTIWYMYHHKKYRKMVFYIEACESGSMMNHLADNINVYATTAANPKESSYACYYDDERQTYLGDWYSVNWMEDSDMEDLRKETLHKQFQLVRLYWGGGKALGGTGPDWEGLGGNWEGLGQTGRDCEGTEVNWESTGTNWDELGGTERHWEAQMRPACLSFPSRLSTLCPPCGTGMNWDELGWHWDKLGWHWDELGGTGMNWEAQMRPACLSFPSRLSTLCPPCGTGMNWDKLGWHWAELGGTGMNWEAQMRPACLSFPSRLSTLSPPCGTGMNWDKLG